MPSSGRNFNAFQQGAGTAPEAASYCCAECGYTSGNRKHFKSHGRREDLLHRSLRA